MLERLYTEHAQLQKDFQQQQQTLETEFLLNAKRRDNVRIIGNLLDNDNI